MSDITGVAKYDRGLIETLARKTPGIGLKYPLERATGYDPFSGIIEAGKKADDSIEEALRVITDSIRELRVPLAEGGIVRQGFENLGRVKYNTGGLVINDKTIDKETRIRLDNIDNDLKRLGYSRVARAAILGNIHVETGGTYDHQQKQDNGNGYGLYQFDFQKKFYMENEDSYLASNNFEDTPMNQTMFVHESINQLAPGKHTVDKNKIRQLQRDLQGDDVARAAISFSENYLQPGTPHIDRRRDAARTIYKVLGD